ncbi:polysaccharide deacetylase family protein [Roseiconus lacunae]|uniref:polysaccharide deacetylase family protein n=1 Tax=Roseiconus lacunae TaxID=2605694 RepID=UPI0011F27521|nr:polysaccharide deacetylase family protein [Roseiconus lacunae]
MNQGKCKPRVLISIHDVMPETMTEVGELIELCQRSGHSAVALLIVPGQPWTDSDLNQIRRWEQAGCELAGHGWHHRCQSVRGLKHRIHSLLLSRQVAEHLCLSASEIETLMGRCSAWFAERQLPLPNLYVPPAWALGTITALQLARLPFRLVETLSGVVRVEGTVKRLRMPLLGFEADSSVRRRLLRVFNEMNYRYARSRWNTSAVGIPAPVRISIHPFDHRLRLRDDLCRVLDIPWKSIRYSDLLGSTKDRIRSTIG